MKPGAAMAGWILIAGVLPLAAHHSLTASHDLGKPVTITGTVVRIEWRNPHPVFYVDVRDVKGVTTWKVESPGGFAGTERVGVTRESLKPQDNVTMEVFTGIGSEPSVVRAVTLRDGQSITLPLTWTR